MTEEIRLPERLEGAVLGHLVGDALGVPYEFRSASDVGTVTWRGHGAHRQPAGTWSDDGALMLALLDSLLAAGFDPDDQGRRARDWRDHGRYAPGGVVFDIGGATSASLERLDRGVPAEQAGEAGEALGNGSLMRILPLALVERDLPDAALIDHASRASSVTHAHPLCRVACELYVLLVRRFLAGATDRPAVLAEVRRTVRSLHEGRADARELEALTTIEAWRGREGRGHVVDSFWSAWDAFAGAGSYRDAVVNAVAHGHDTDTTAAIAGGLAGTYWGVDGIPTEWLHGLREPSIIRPLLDALIEGDGWRTSTFHPLRLDPLDLSGLDALDASSGRVSLTFLPGKQRDGWTGRHWRDLETDAARLEEARVGAIVLFVEDEELRTSRIRGIEERLPAHGVELLRFPIDDDAGLPGDPAAYGDLISGLVERVRNGEHIVLACRGGLDRTGTGAGCLLAEAGACWRQR